MGLNIKQKDELVEAIDGLKTAPPTGAATSANQVTGNNSLASIDTKTSTVLDRLQTIIDQTAPLSGSLTNYSGSITSGGTSQVVVAANANRKYLIIQNISDENMYINFGASAIADDNSIKILPNNAFEMNRNSFISTESINIVSATAGKKFVAKEG